MPERDEVSGQETKKKLADKARELYNEFANGAFVSDFFPFAHWDFLEKPRDEFLTEVISKTKRAIRQKVDKYLDGPDIDNAIPIFFDETIALAKETVAFPFKGWEELLESGDPGKKIREIWIDILVNLQLPEKVTVEDLRKKAEYLYNLNPAKGRAIFLSMPDGRLPTPRIMFDKEWREFLETSTPTCQADCWIGKVIRMQIDRPELMDILYHDGYTDRDGVRHTFAFGHYKTGYSDKKLLEIYPIQK